MAISSTAIAAIGLGMQVFGMMGQQDAQDDARRAKEQEAAAYREKAAAEKRMADIKNAQAVREQLRQARIRSAQVSNVGATAAPGGSSILSGAGGVQTQLGYNLGVGSALSSNNDISYSATGRIADATIAGANAGYDYQQSSTIMGLGNTIFGMGGGFKTLFGGKGGTSGNDGLVLANHGNMGNQ